MTSRQIRIVLLCVVGIAFLAFAYVMAMEFFLVAMRPIVVERGVGRPMKGDEWIGHFNAAAGFAVATLGTFLVLLRVARTIRGETRGQPRFDRR